MKKTGRFLAVMLTLALTLCLCACGGMPMSPVLLTDPSVLQTPPPSDFTERVERANELLAALRTTVS